MAFKPFLIFLIFHIITVSITHAQPQPYSPGDNIVLDCGSSKNNRAADGRRWDGDINNKIFPLDDGQNNASITSNAVESSTHQQNVPYGTARLSLSEFSYSIPVTPGQKFIRLYFYAANYQDFDRSKASFSVKTGQYTLLNNFSTSLNADFLRKQVMMREFCVTVEKSILNIRFSPTSSIPEAFAFINGIEVVSMPANLYFPDPDVENSPKGIEFVGTNTYLPLQDITALETAYRINIGGIFIGPPEDTGMFRSWDVENMYLTEEGVSIFPVNSTAKLQFTAIPAYTAPEVVYRTARSERVWKSRSDAVQNYTLTWEFPVDNGFNYLVRLHFCEIAFSQMKEAGDRVFDIFLANQSAEKSFDIVRESGDINVPFKEDFVVSMNLGDGGKKVNLSVSLKPIVYQSISTSQYLDATLNGVEIFKMNSSNGNLAAPNPDPILVTPPSQKKESQKKDSQKKESKDYLIGIIAGLVSGVVVLSVIAFLIFRRGRKLNNLWGLVSLSKFNSTKTKGLSLPLDTCRYFSLAQIRAATNNFHETYLIGVGGFGNVYKGCIDGGVTPIAIKRQKPESSQGAHEFKTEIEMLSHLRHRHIVSLIGYCDDDREMILVYEYMERGTLSNHLYNTDKPPLPWEQRLQICIGAALGLHYLHFGAKQRIIHRDVKSTNILLDKKWVAKVSDFGLSKVSHMSKSHVSTAVKGSIGYLDPEYYKRQQLTEKSDVYSFGVVLCEVLCGRPPVVPNVERQQMNLAEWFRCCYHDGTIDEIVDPQIKGKIEPDCLFKYSEIAFNCILDDGAERPSMKEVAWSLELSLQLQRKSNEPATGMNGEDEVPVRCFSWDGTSGAVFSEINDLNAR